MEKPDVDQIEGLSPAISIDQKGASRNPVRPSARSPRSRLPAPPARRGAALPELRREIGAQTVEQIVGAIVAYPEGNRLSSSRPGHGAQGRHKGIFDDIRKAGFVARRVDSQMIEVDGAPELDNCKAPTRSKPW